MSNYWRAPLRNERGRERAWSETPEFRDEWQRTLAARRAARGKTGVMERHARRLQWLETTKAMQAESARERGGASACSDSGAPAQEGNER